ncbi:MAG: hypothetical protein PF486_09670 [Prolixibacteraceae bacterium]|jgi:hypothetical protein|nr:hypothetical protein [Prolixibacteraceae bacterium]
MKIFFCITTLFIVFGFCSAKAQEEKTEWFMSSGVGYFNEDGMIDGSMLSAELGVKMKNNYLFSLRVTGAETMNNRGSWPNVPGNVDLIYTYKIISLNTGYEFETKNRHHSVIPTLGAFYGDNRIIVPSYYSEEFDLHEDHYYDLGALLAMKYEYNFNDNLSLGVRASTCLAMYYGFLYYSALPVFTLRF